jgi:hypothetical protein
MAIKFGTNGKDSITGTSGNDELYALGGSDRIYANPGNDKLFGGDGEDGLYGQAGDDIIYGGNGIDALFGHAGADSLYGEAGNDYMLAGDGADYLKGGSGNDRLRGEAGNDTLNGGSGDNDLQGGSGNDTLIHYGRAADGMPGGKAIYGGGEGIDTLLFDVQGPFPTDDSGTELAEFVSGFVGEGGSGGLDYATDPIEPSSARIGSFSGIEEFKLQNGSNMKLDFSAYVDAKVTGGALGDYLEGGEGNQDFTGGGGDDNYLFRWREGENGGSDIIHGFSQADGDLIYYNNMPESATEDPLKIEAVETDGHTIYTATEIATGSVVHTLDVDAIGLPLPSYYI